MLKVLSKIKFLYKHPLIIGVDISDHSIEVLQLTSKREIKAYARSVLDDGIIESGQIKNSKLLSQIFNQTIERAGFDKIRNKKNVRVKGVFSLPESRAFIREFTLEPKKKLKKEVEEKIKKNIPFLIKEVYWDYLVLSKNEKETKVLTVVISKKIIDQYIYFFWKNEVDPVVFDIEGNSIARSLLPSKESKHTAIVNIGANTSIINVFNKARELTVSSTIFYAGDYFDQEVAKKLKLDNKTARKQKQKQGFKEEPVAPILKESSNIIIKETKEALDYYTKKYGFQVEKIILTGGSSLLPGIKQYFQSQLDQDVEISNPLNKEGSNFLSEAVLFSNVIGLALRGLNDNLIYSGINLLPENIKRKEKLLQAERKRFFWLVILYILAIIIFILAIIFVLL